MIDLTTIARISFESALRRKKTKAEIVHKDDAISLSQEFTEFYQARETAPSEHLPKYTEAQEELADIMISCLTELYKRGTDIEGIILEKITFNQQRK